jgi:hypothetical protein
MDGRIHCGGRCRNARGMTAPQRQATRRANQSLRQKPVQPLSQKYIAFAVGQISSTSSPRPFPVRGALAIVTNAGWDAVDAAASARKVIAGRVSRERATGAQDERRWLRTAKPCGPDTRCWCQVERRRSQLNPPTTVTRRIRRRGEQGISRKAIAQGMPDCLR